MPTWISNFSELKTYLSHRYGSEDFLIDHEIEGVAGFPLRIPYQYADQIDWQDAQDPLRLMVMPTRAENIIQPYELADPIGDSEKEVVPGLIHRYPDRCLLLLTSHCRVHCRFCFRREVVGDVRPVDFKAIKNYLQMHPEIHEVIFSGGDPGTFPPAFLDNVCRQLADISHITRWRFHSRVPAVEPGAISDDWLQAVSQFNGKKIIVVHINHPRELTAPVQQLLEKMLRSGILLLSQSVLLKGVNADTATLAELFTALVAAGVKPYYLHHLDRAHGTSQFRVSIEEGKRIFMSLRGTLSSVCMPEYVVDLPGGFGKTPVMWLERLDKKTYKAQTFENKEVIYTDFGT